MFALIKRKNFEQLNTFNDLVKIYGPVHVI